MGEKPKPGDQSNSYYGSQESNGVLQRREVTMVEVKSADIGYGTYRYTYVRKSQSIVESAEM